MERSLRFGVPGEPALARVLLPSVCGILTGGLVATYQGGTTAALATVAGVLAVAVIALTFLRGLTQATLAAFAIGVAAAIAVPARDRVALSADHVGRYAGRDTTAIEGMITRQERSGGALRLVVRAERLQNRRRRREVGGLLQVTVAHPQQAWSTGSKVRVVGRVRRPRNFGNPGGYDFERTLARRGIRATMFLWDDTTIALVAAPRASFSALVARVRARAQEHISARTAEPVRGYLIAVLLGDGGALDRETWRNLSRTGLAHVVSVSGFHVAVVAGTAIAVLRFLFRRFSWLMLHADVSKLAAIGGLVPVAAYLGVAGGSVPATRSLCMYLALLAAHAADRPTDGLRGLAAAALVMALGVPDIAADVSFELSFASVAALLIAGGRIAGRVPTPGRMSAKRLIVASLIASVAVTMATAPLTAWHFQQISLIGPLANLLALPLLGPATLLPGLTALLAFPVAPALADLLVEMAAIAAELGLGIAGGLARVPAAALTTPMPSLLEVGLYYALVALPFVPRELAPACANGASSQRPRTPAASGACRRVRARALVAALVATIAVADVGYWIWERTWNPKLRVTFLSVGQGDAAVVELPRGGVMVVDGGGLPGDFDTGERLIAPFLRGRKIMWVDALVLSHPQLDHYGGLAYLAEHFAPREFWSNGLGSSARAFGRLELALDSSGTRRRTLRRGMPPIELGDVRFDVAHPATPVPADPNNGSLVLRLTHGAATFFLTGDIEREAEDEIIAASAIRDLAPRRAAFAAPIASSVLKVPHHGSETSSSATLLASVAPRVAVISAGADNRFGFPAPEVVARLEAVGAEVWRTDRDGAVRVESDGARLVVTTPSRPARPSRVFDLKSPHPFGSSERFRKSLDEKDRWSEGFS